VSCGLSILKNNGRGFCWYQEYYEAYEVTKEINLDDGTHIEQGTEFMEEGFGTGEYEFSLFALKDFSVPAKWAVDKELFECAKENIINSISN